MARVRVDRSQQIIEQVLRNNAVSIEELAANFHVSQATIRRELRRLQAEGLLERSHGGAVPIQTALYRPYLADSSFAEQVSRQVREKARIGIEAARLVKEGDTIAISAGTTTTQAARSLDHRIRLTVFTNALNIGMELSQRRNLKVIVSGGIIQGGWFSLAGPGAIDSVQEHYFDWFFLGASGVSGETGVSDQHIEEAAVNRAIMKQARRTVLLVDHTKFGVQLPALICPLNALHAIITDRTTADFRDLPNIQRQVAEVLFV